VIPSILAESPNEVLLNVYWLCPCPQSEQQQVPPLVVICNYVLEDIRTRMLRFFPDVSTHGGGSLRHFYADASQRVFGIQIEATSLLTKQETIQQLLVPVQTLKALKALTRSPVYRRASCYEPFIGRRLAYASRAAGRKLQC